MGTRHLRTYCFHYFCFLLLAFLYVQILLQTKLSNALMKANNSMSEFIYWSGWLFWALVALVALAFIYELFIKPLLQSISVTLLACYALKSNKESVPWDFPHKYFKHQFMNTFFLSPYTTTKVSTKLYVWNGIFSWTLLRQDVCQDPQSNDK
jgi:hypothetical protein